MAALSQSHALALLTSSLRGNTVYLALCNSDPTSADSGTEVSGGSYARRIVSFSEPSLVNGVATCVNSADVTFPRATSSWGEVTHWEVKDAATGGSMKWFGTFTRSKTVETNDEIKIPSGELRITLE